MPHQQTRNWKLPKMTIFWDAVDVVFQKLTNVSEVLTASIIIDCPDDEGSKHL
jgi:hypothetical protein